MVDLVLHSPTNPHFFQPLLPGFHSHLSIPVAFFSKHLQGLNKHKTAKIRSDASDAVWEVELENGRRLTQGWKEFATAHDLRIGDVIVFRYEGDLVFHVTVLGPSCCEIEYTPSLNTESKPMKTRVKMNPRRKEVSSSSDNYCFMGFVTPSSLRKDSQYLPRRFVSLNGLKKGCSQMILKNENGGTWKLVIRHSKPNDTTVMARGWRSFCEANGLKDGDYFRFKLVRTGGKPTLCLCPAEIKSEAGLVACLEGNNVNSLSTNPNNEEEVREAEESGEKKSIEENLDNVKDGVIIKEENNKEEISSRECLNIKKKICSGLGASSSSSESRFVKLTVTPYSVRGNKLRLPISFLRANGIVKPGKIALLGTNGVYWTVHLVRDDKCGRMRLGDGWKEFCEIHGVKIGESFVLECIWEKDASLVLKFCTKLKHERDF